MTILCFSPSIVQGYIEYTRFSKEASKIWTYETIETKGIQYVWNTPEFQSWRVSYDWPFQILFVEKINCILDNWDIKLYHSFSGTPFPFREWDTRDNPVSFYFWWEWYVYNKPANDCEFTSCQFLDYYGYPKSQCFKSSKYNILEK